ncbi:aprataxin and PNK-like factor isoform X1 [Haliotis cracherodii]|uniref:aprataxin and PNK-like factor isoform X1 n=2 Tax=Haliotis cracherodii TaxID=6455 RepID=UPI0039EBE4C7
MSGIYLQSTEGGEVIEVPLAKTVIGRGPFLQITDKRVSRSHAELQVTDKSLYITPTHTNPCFLRRGGGDTQVALSKDEKCKLAIGDVFGLLPEQLFFTVCGKQGAINGTSIKEESLSQSDSKVKSEPKSLDRTVKDEDPDDFLDDVGRDLEDSPTPRKKTKNKDSGPAVVKVRGKLKMALPLDKQRTLPDWMIKMAAVGPVPEKKKKPTAKIPAVAKRGAESSTPASPRKRAAPRRTYVDDYDDEEEEEPQPVQRNQKRKRKTLSEEEEEEEERKPRRRARPSRRAAAYDDDDDDDFSPRKRPQRAARESRGSYVDDFIPDDDSDASLPDHLKRVKDDDSDFEIDDGGGGDSGSDWESKGKGKRGKSKGKALATPRRASGRRGRPRKVRDDDEEDDDEEDDDEAYVPRPSKRRGTAPKRKKMESEEEEEEEEKTPSKERGAVTKKRLRCPYGKKCYRKNPAHFKDVCHPGDTSYDEASEEEGDDDENVDNDDDKPECEFGTDCYRKNADHLKKYSHKKKADDQPKRKPAKKDGKTSVLAKDDDDNGEPNTYDYNDSFIDDIGQSYASESSYGDPEEEDSDYDPEEEDVRSLMKEAKGFVKKKKMRQPVGKKIEIKAE